MENQERVFIIIDGSNFYHRLKEIPNLSGSLLNFHYNDFIKWFVGERIIINKKYYIGAIRAKPNDQKAQKLRANQQRLFARLKQNGWEIAYGLITHSDIRRLLTEGDIGQFLIDEK